MGGTGWAVEMSKVLNKVLYVYDVERNMWLWYNSYQDLFTACDQMSEEQYALPTLVKKTAIIGVRNIYDYPEALLELQETFKRSLNLPNKETRMSRNFVTHLNFYLFYELKVFSFAFFGPYFFIM